MPDYTTGTVLTCSHEDCNCRVQIEAECDCVDAGAPYTCTCGAPMVQVVKGTPAYGSSSDSGDPQL